MRAERRLKLPAELQSVRVGRLFARDAVVEWGLESLVDDVQLGVSELVTNAVKHAQTEVELTLRLEGKLVVEVRDQDPDLRHPATPSRDLLSTSGRGLQIVAAVSNDWGIRSVEGGKAVWFAVPLPDARIGSADVFELSDRRDEHERAAQAQRAVDGSREMQASASG